MRDRSDWIKGATGSQTINGRPYPNLTAYTRPCATCNKPFSIYVTGKIASGRADSNSFGLRNCEEHRRNKSAADSAGTEALVTANNTMRDELTGLYARVKEMFEELQVAKARLATYELQGAMKAQAHKMPWE